ncbi:hypothetical protein, partial [Cytobacillus oceanisediminis]|uniref:hypothetical protein n=1 Tax=Cytobacillus oceanisediminis TaxID=665099 RepID=UPI001C9306A4
MGIGLREVWVGEDCGDEKYEEIMGKGIGGMRKDGVSDIGFGDIDVEDVGEYGEELLCEWGR